MKKTFNINISGYGFVIDEDAYQMLDSYLATLNQICSREGQNETASDIELRIAEIFTERFSAPGPAIITLSDVQEVIGRMGSPEEIVGVEVEAETAGPQGAAPPPFAAVPARKRLYRDIDNKVLGGVCSGLAWYLGIDVVWIRIIMVALLFLSATTMGLIYLVLWIVIPPAKSPYERMQMMGMDPSVKNVGRVVTGEYDPYRGSGRPDREFYDRMRASSASSGASGAGKVIVMILLALGLLIVGGLLLAMSTAFIGCLLAVCIAPGYYSDMAEAKLVMGCVMGGCLVVGIPLFLLFRSLVGALTERNFRPFTSSQRLALLIPWLLGVAACIVCGIILGQ